MIQEQKHKKVNLPIFKPPKSLGGPHLKKKTDIIWTKLNFKVIVQPLELVPLTNCLHPEHEPWGQWHGSNNFCYSCQQSSKKNHLEVKAVKHYSKGVGEEKEEGTKGRTRQLGVRD